MQKEIIESTPKERVLIDKIRTLAPEKIAEVENFVDFLSFKDRDRGIMFASNRLSEHVFSKAWDNSEDDEYDRL